MEQTKTIAEQYHSGLDDLAGNYVDALFEIVRFSGHQLKQSAKGNDQTVVSKDLINARLAPLGLKVTGDIFIQGTVTALKAI